MKNNIDNQLATLEKKESIIVLQINNIQYKIILPTNDNIKIYSVIINDNDNIQMCEITENNIIKILFEYINDKFKYLLSDMNMHIYLDDLLKNINFPNNINFSNNRYIKYFVLKFLNLFMSGYFIQTTNIFQNILKYIDMQKTCKIYDKELTTDEYNNYYNINMHINLYLHNIAQSQKINVFDLLKTIIPPDYFNNLATIEFCEL